MTINVAHLKLEHNGEPIVEVNVRNETATTLFRGVSCFRNEWDIHDLEPRVVAELREAGFFRATEKPILTSSHRP
ncbi:MAG: hypothetical protein M3418_08315 [Gemmatimonadota bacterium]|jgi:hypothetical protein|nr:hypothetical protein [Gemmatimonadota bacterium]